MMACPHTAQSLAEKFPQATVYAGVRDPASEKAKPLAASGANVKLFKLDLGDKSTFGNIPKNATGLFVNTPGDFYTPVLGIAGVDAAKAAGVC
jgi:hypothetical protein